MHIKNMPASTAGEIADILKMSESGVRKNLYVLRAKGYIERVGSKKAGYWKVLNLTECD